MNRNPREADPGPRPDENLQAEVEQALAVVCEVAEKSEEVLDRVREVAHDITERVARVTGQGAAPA
jgi:predicted P-loop ATPase/GTPase